MATKLAVLTDSTLFRAGIEHLVAAEPDLVFVGAARDSDILELLANETPDVVILDYEMDGFLPLSAAIRRGDPNLPMLVMSNSLGEEALRTSIEAGARGYLYKDTDFAELGSAVRLMASGAAVIDPRVARQVIAWARQRPIDVEGEALSQRELEVVGLLARGEPNKRIAKRLGIKENTVKTYLRRAYRKLQCNTRAEAVAAASRRGLL